MKRRREAVALEYGQREAPVVSAKGSDELAEAIIAEARRQGVYVTEDKALVAALSRLDLEQEIPRDLYVAVAVVLSWAYWLRGMKPGDEKGGIKPLRIPARRASAPCGRGGHRPRPVRSGRCRAGYAGCRVSHRACG